MKAYVISRREWGNYDGSVVGVALSLSGARELATENAEFLGYELDSDTWEDNIFHDKEIYARCSYDNDQRYIYTVEEFEAKE